MVWGETTHHFEFEYVVQQTVRFFRREPSSRGTSCRGYRTAVFVRCWNTHLVLGEIEAFHACRGGDERGDALRLAIVGADVS